MSSFPRRLDVFPFLVDSVSTGRTQVSRDKLPDTQEVLARLYSALEAVESHVGFAALSGGDTPINAAPQDPGPGRTVCLLETDHVITSAEGGKSGIMLRWDSLFDEGPLSRSLPTPCPANQRPVFSARLASDFSLPLPLRVQDPILVCATRSHGSLTAGLVPGADASAYIPISISDGSSPFIPGERLHLSLFFYGGTL